MIKPQKMVAWAVKHAPKDLLGDSMVQAAQESGWQATWVYDADPAGLRADVLVMYGHGRNFEVYARQLRRLQRAGRKRPRTVLWQADPYPPPDSQRGSAGKWMKWADALGWRLEGMRLPRGVVREICKPLLRIAVHELKRSIGGAMSEIDYRMLQYTMECERWVKRGLQEEWLDEVFASTMHKWDHLKQLGIDSTFAPVGYAPFMGEDRGQDAERDIDVLFLGTVRAGLHRALVLDRLERECKQAGLVMRVVREGCYGQERTALLNRTKMVLHLHQFPWDTPWIRMFMATVNGAMMVSEVLIDERPLEAGIHLVMAEESELVGVIKHYAQHEQERRAMVDRMRLKMMQEMTLAMSVGRILKTNETDGDGT